MTSDNISPNYLLSRNFQYKHHLPRHLHIRTQHLLIAVMIAVMIAVTTAVKIAVVQSLEWISLK